MRSSANSLKKLKEASNCVWLNLFLIDYKEIFDETINTSKQPDSSLLQKYEDLISTLKSDLKYHKDVNHELTTRLEEAVGAPKDKASNAMKNLIKALHLIKKSRKILTVSNSRNTVASTEGKPSKPSMPVRKRDAKALEKQEEDNQEKSKMQKTEE